MEIKNNNGLTLKEFLSKYDASKYRNPSVTIDISVFTLVEQANMLLPAIMLIRRGDHPFIGMRAFPGGFVEFDEEISAAANRELMEETGVIGLINVPYGTFGSCGRDPRTRIITIGHIAFAPYGTLIPKAGDDAVDATVYTIQTTLIIIDGITRTYELKFDNGFGDEFSYCATVEKGILCDTVLPINNSPMAGDHGQLLVYALKALCAYDTDVLLTLLAPHKLPSSRCAIEQLKTVFLA